MMGLTMQTYELTEIQRAVRSHFQKGGSILEAILVLLAIVGAVLLVRYLTHKQREAQSRTRPADPRRLFRDLLDKLKLGARQRQLLDAVARDLHLASPATILLCPALFDRRIDEWRSQHAERTTGATEASSSDLAMQIRGVLFPTN
jgi:hypothetical protein